MFTVLPSSVGDLRLVAADGALTHIEFSPFDDTLAVGERVDDDPLLVAARQQLTAYFAGEREGFDLPLAPVGTPFQQRVWAELRTIGYGRTVSYGELAHRLGHTNAASRAVGAANGRNPLPVVIPCHRVIGASGRLTGYAGGLGRKRILLDLEQATFMLAPSPPFTGGYIVQKGPR